MSWKPQSQQYGNSVQMNMTSPPATPYRNYYNNNDGPYFQSASKLNNLSNSAVLQLLKENENAGKKEVLWPPPPEDYEVIDNYRNEHHGPQIPHHTLLIKKETKPFQPPPQFIPLKESAPRVQNSVPVYKSQPVTDYFHGDTRTIGDEKWPPSTYRYQIEAENDARLNLVRSPQVRPRRVRKDYTSFFSKNSIPNSYAGYKPPPGTQHHDESYY